MQLHKIFSDKIIKCFTEWSPRIFFVYIERRILQLKSFLTIPNFFAVAWILTKCEHFPGMTPQALAKNLKHFLSQKRTEVSEI
jgi:hypothetical protein